MSGVIRAINRTNSNIDGHLKVLKQDSAKELQEWGETQDLVNKYYETAEKSSSSLEHMAKFSDQELAILRTMQGEYGTHFDRIYNKSNSILDATRDLNTTNSEKLDVVNTSIKEFSDKIDIEAINDVIKESSDLEQSKIDELRDLIAEKTDEQTESLIASISGAATTITNDIKVDIDTKGIEDKLDNINGELASQTDLMEEFGKGGKRNLGGCRDNGNCPVLVDSNYPDGLTGMLNKHYGNIRENAFIGVIEQFNVNLPAKAPEWRLCLDIIFDFGCYDIRLPEYIWSFIRICMMFGASMTFRRLVFGG